MRLYPRLAALAITAALILPVPPLAAQEAFPDLRGAWSGTGWGAVSGQLQHVNPTAGPEIRNPTVLWTLTITKQDGGGLIGTWSSPSRSETLIGAVRANRESVVFVDEDSYFSGTLLSDTEMELCLQETGKSMVAVCFVLRRQ
ncbi:hypothetical protein [uncultured Sneathiella sp.]|uniref:hypothetical protein n=1 Tax=uncultured Sneathiella sp. TaxID=879315 RepID=UPI0030ED6414